MVMPGRMIRNGQAYRYGYQGEFAETDEETGKPAFQLRLYDPRLGRWISPDPMSQYHSPYMAMDNRPNMSVDPTGGCTDPNCNHDYHGGSLAEVTITAKGGGGLQPAGLDMSIFDSQIAGLPAYPLPVHIPWEIIRNPTPKPTPSWGPALAKATAFGIILTTFVSDTRAPDPYGPGDSSDDNPLFIYRAMKSGPNGFPLTGESSSKLGVRTQFTPNVQRFDIWIGDDGNVTTMSGNGLNPIGMSTSLDPSRLLSRGLPVYGIEVHSLPPGLLAFPDGGSHVTVAPASTMPYIVYSGLIYSTQGKWKLYSK
jgi:RHS repeat-associated protein